MSRGLGKIQSNVLSYLKSIPLPISEDQLLWYLAECKDQIKRKPISEFYNEGFILDSFYKSFRRAWTGLVKNKTVTIDSKYKLNSFDDLIKYYPFKTRNITVKKLRVEFLPFVKKYVEDNIYRVKFKNHQVELFNLGNFKETNPKIYNICVNKWLGLRLNIIDWLANGDEKTKNPLIKLLAKGEELFSQSEISVAEQTSTIINSLTKLYEEKETKELDSFKELKAFFEECVYGNEYSRDMFKNKLYLVASFYKRSSPILNEEFKEALIREFPERIKSLPKTKLSASIEKTKEGRIDFFSYGDDEIIDPIINKLILRDVFSAIKLITEINL